MESIINYINEAKESTRWVAIEITTNNHRYGYGEHKNSTSKRVVSEDTYRQLKNERQTASGLEIVELNVLAGPTRDKDEAMAAIETEKKVRSTPIKKGDADYIVYAMNIGKFTPTGKTKYDWNLWEESKNGEAEIYVDKRGSIFLWGAKGSLKKGDRIVCVDNDTQKKIAPYYKEVGAVLPADSRESFTEAYRKEFPDYCKKPTFAFGKQTDGLPLSRFQQIYSIKGISE
jgi:hypothetical protein